jgi:phospholipase/carboxylesterase
MRGLAFTMLAAAIAAAAACGRGSSGPDPSTGRSQAQARSAPAPVPPVAASAAPDERSAAGLVYEERVFGGADADARLPLVVMIHGLGDTPSGIAQVFEGWRARARVVLPQAPTVWGDSGYSWFDVRVSDGRVAALEAGILAAAEKLAAFLEAIVAARPTEGQPIVAGFSQGGILSFALALHHPSRLRLAVPIAGYLPGVPERLDATPPIIAFHGTDDDLIPIAGTRTLVTTLRDRGVDVTLHELSGVAHRIPLDATRRFLRVLEAHLR